VANGQSSNKVSPYASHANTVDGRRWLVSAAFIGDFQRGSLSIRQTSQVTFFEEKTDVYSDSLGVSIPEVTVRLGQLTAGPELIWQLERADGSVWSPQVKLDAVLTFASDSPLDDNLSFAGTGVTGRLELGIGCSVPTGWSLNARLSLDSL
jgi:hypothetical protein